MITLSDGDKKIIVANIEDKVSVFQSDEEANFKELISIPSDEFLKILKKVYEK